MHSYLAASSLILGLATIGWSADAKAQDSREESRDPFRTRVALGAQLVPSFPGSDEVSVRPLIDVSRARGETQFDFEAPDESFGFPLLRSGALAIGPAIGLEGSRGAEDVGAAVPKIGFTFELGAFIQYQLAERIRARVELRRGLGGHAGWIGIASADYVMRDKDDWLVSIGPRLTLADDRYQSAYFGIAPGDAAASGLPTFRAGGGLQAAGVAALYLRRLSPRWGLYTYGKYDRLLGDAGASPIVRQLGSRDQISGGMALSYTFGP